MIKIKSAQFDQNIKSVLSNFEEMKARVQQVSATVENLMANPQFNHMSFEEFTQQKSAEGIDIGYLLQELRLI